MNSKKLASLATSAAPRGAVPLPIIEALNNAAGGNDWQGDATPSDLMGPAIAAIERLATSAAGEPVAEVGDFLICPDHEGPVYALDTLRPGQKLYAASAPTQPAEPSEHSALLTVVAEVVESGHLNLENLARLRAFVDDSDAAPPAPERAERVQGIGGNTEG